MAEPRLRFAVAVAAEQAAREELWTQPEWERGELPELQKLVFRKNRRTWLHRVSHRHNSSKMPGCAMLPVERVLPFGLLLHAVPVLPDGLVRPVHLVRLAQAAQVGFGQAGLLGARVRQPEAGAHLARLVALQPSGVQGISPQYALPVIFYRWQAFGAHQGGCTGLRQPNLEPTL